MPIDNSYRNLISLPKVEITLSLCWAHCKKLSEMACEHNSQECTHKHSRWERRYLGKGHWGLQPIYYNSQPQPYLWFEREEWTE